MGTRAQAWAAEGQDEKERGCPKGEQKKKRDRDTNRKERSRGRSPLHGQDMGNTQDHRKSIEQWLAVGGGWRLVAVSGGWWRLAVGGWWRLAVGGWRLAAAGPWGLSLTKRKLGFVKDSPEKKAEAAHSHTPPTHSAVPIQSRPPGETCVTSQPRGKARWREAWAPSSKAPLTPPQTSRVRWASTGGLHHQGPPPPREGVMRMGQPYHCQTKWKK